MDVMSSLNSIVSNGINNDGGAITTDGSGHITAANGILRNVTFLATPYHLYTNPTVNSGATRTDTVTGVGGIPSGIVAIILCVNLYSVTAGGTCQIYPTGGTPGQYNNFTPQWAANNQYTGMGITVVPVSGAGQITVKAVNQNMVLSDWYIFGYIA